MTTTLLLTLDEPGAALHHDDPVAWTAGYVRDALMRAGVVVHDCDQHAELVLGATRPPVAEPAPQPGVHECPLPWCRATFAKPNHLKLHMRTHQSVDCRWCHQPYKLQGLASHERSCACNPANDQPARPRPARPPREHRHRAPRLERIHDEPAKPPPPPMPDLGPIERRRFDPDRVRAAACTGAYDVDPFS